jgi:hypothetical protein
MNTEKNRDNLIPEINKALDKAIKKVIAETKAKNSYMVVSDKKGNIIKIHARDL